MKPTLRPNATSWPIPPAQPGLPLVGLTTGVDAPMERTLLGERRLSDAASLVREDASRRSRPIPAALQRRARSSPCAAGDPPAHVRYLGPVAQNALARLHVGIVGLGSVGCLVAEAIARMGVGRVTLIDPDRIEEHNLDRLLYGTVRDIGRLKVDAAAEAMGRNATANNIDVTALPLSVHQKSAYEHVLDCDIIFSCVDRPLARDVLNFVSQAHMIPVVDGGVSVEFDAANERLFSTHWRAHVASPSHQCLRCRGQYNSSLVIMELDGSLNDPSYIRNLPTSERPANQNVFAFSQGVASMEVNLMLRYLLAADWWPAVHQQEYQFITGNMSAATGECDPNCSFIARHARGDAEEPPYLAQEPSPDRRDMQFREFRRRPIGLIGRLFQRS